MTQIEPGVTVTPAPSKTAWSAKGGEVTTYNLREMTPEAIEQHGLTRYDKAVNADE